MGKTFVRGKAIADEPKLSLTDVEKLVAKYSGVSQKDVRKVIMSYHQVLKEAMRTGFTILIPNMGKWTHYIRRGRCEGDYYDAHEKKMVHKEAQQDYKLPIFLPHKRFTREVTQGTMGQVKALPRGWKDYYVLRRGKLTRKMWDANKNLLPEEYFDNDICRECEEMIGGKENLGHLTKFEIQNKIMKYTKEESDFISVQKSNGGDIDVKE